MLEENVAEISTYGQVKIKTKRTLHGRVETPQTTLMPECLIVFLFFFGGGVMDLLQLIQG